MSQNTPSKSDRKAIGIHAPRERKPYATRSNMLLCLLSSVAMLCAWPISATPLSSTGFAISVDGETLTGAVAQSPKSALDKMDIQVKFDGLEVKPQLNISINKAAGEELIFHALSNYNGWIDHAEVLIFDTSKSADEKLVASLPIAMDGIATFAPPNNSNANVIYVLRVYDSKGRFDETVPMPLSGISKIATRQGQADREILGDKSQDQTALRNIPVYGGAVTVYGNAVPQGNHVSAFGHEIAVDSKGNFVAQQILPAGNHSIAVAVQGQGEEGLSFKREISIPANDWFYIGLADLTVGKSFGGKMLSNSAGDYSHIYTKGRAAFYLKGKIQGKYLLTAAADTGQDNIGSLFKNLDAKDPHHLLRRIDPDQFYPVYGDDSTITEDAPTRGKLYVKLERGDSHVMWGNFKSNVTGAKLIRNERAYDGAHLVYKSENVTSFGERKTEANAYAAQAGTLPQRDVLRGTGGSAYFLKRQDIVAGSETITIEVKDPTSGRVVSRQTLVAGQDYQFDAIQGVVILSKPLSATASASGAVAGVADNIIALVAQYEYTPMGGQLDGYSYGGRVQGWAGDTMRLGASAMQEKTGGVDQRLFGADILLRKSETTFLSAEVAQSQGPGFGRSVSSDGGLTLGTEPTAGNAGKVARAYVVEGQADIAELTGGKLQGRLGGHFENKVAGFSSLAEDIKVSQTSWGLKAALKVTDKASLEASYEDYKDRSGKFQRDAKIDGIFDLNKSWQARIGVDHFASFTPAGPADKNGSRTDIGARLTYKPTENKSAYIYAQTTVARDGKIARNNRIGVGATRTFANHFGLTGDISYGTSGIGAAAGVTYDPSADNHYYLEYRLDPDRTIGNSYANGTDLGGIVLGVKRRYNDVFSAFAESNYDMFGRRRSRNSVYGVSLTPDNYWTVSGGLEAGTVWDKTTSDFSRQAVSLSVGYKDEDRLAARIRGEVRLENSADDSKDRQTYLTTATLSWKTDDNWRFIGNIDAVISHSDQSSILNGRYVEASMGMTYRPVDNDRFNALLKYTFLYDLPGADQVNANGNLLGPAQRSHIFSADASYDVNQYLTIGAKYGFRLGQVSTSRISKDFTTSSAHLGIIRADFHLVHNWDAVLEARILTSPSAKTTNYGALAAVYRQFGKNLKVGVGYNFGKFSDDLADITYDDQGVFLNVTGTF